MFVTLYRRDGSVLAIDLGHLTVVSNLASRDSSVRVRITLKFTYYLFHVFRVAT